MLGYVEDSLLPNEEVQYRTGFHWIMFLKPAIILLITGFMAMTISLIPDSSGVGTVFMFAFTLAFLYTMHQAALFYTAEFAVTSTRVMVSFGVVSRESRELNRARVEALQVTQSVMGRLLNYGTLTFVGTGGTPITVPFVARPLDFRRHAAT